MLKVTSFGSSLPDRETRVFWKEDVLWNRAVFVPLTPYGDVSPRADGVSPKADDVSPKADVVSIDTNVSRQITVRFVRFALATFVKYRQTSPLRAVWSVLKLQLVEDTTRWWANECRVRNDSIVHGHISVSRSVTIGAISIRQLSFWYDCYCVPLTRHETPANPCVDI